MHTEDSQLKEFVLDSGLVSRVDIEMVEKEAKETGENLGKILVNRGRITEDDFRSMQAHILGIPFVDLKTEKFPFDVLSLIPEPIVRNYNIIAFRKTDTDLEVAMLDTKDLSTIDFIKQKVGLKILPRLTDTESMKSAILQYQKFLKAEFGDLIQKEINNIKNISYTEEVDWSEEDLKDLANDISVVRIIDNLLKHAILQNASDVHIEPREGELLVRYRLNGFLHDAMILPKSAIHGVTARLKMLAGLKLDEKRLPQEGKFKMEFDNEKVSFRVSSLPTYFGEKIVMRLLREVVSGFTLESLSFHGEGLEAVHKAMKSTSGMILVTGPADSGKTTTLYTMLDILNTPNINISTIEDPIKCQIKRINQTQVRPEIGFTFANGLRTLVHQDSDVIMISDIRDNETASLALGTALRGHLVLSALNVNSAAKAVTHLIRMGAEPLLVASALNIVISQRLVKKLADKKEKYFLSKSEISTLRKSANLEKVLKKLKEEKIVGKSDTWDKISFWRLKKNVSLEDGFSGRICLQEVLKVSGAIKEIILKSGTAEAIQVQAEKEGMLTLCEDGIFKAVQGLTTLDEVFY